MDEWTLLLCTVGLLVGAVWLLAWSAFLLSARLNARMTALEDWRDGEQAVADGVWAALTRPESEGTHE